MEDDSQPVDLDMLDQILSKDNCNWFETPNSSSFSPLLASSSSVCSEITTQRSIISTNLRIENTNGTQFLDSNAIQRVFSVQSSELHDSRTSWGSSLNERLMHALSYFKETQIDPNVLVQLWVPEKRGNQLVLSTREQPYFLDPNCEKLVNYREISANYQFSAEVDCEGALGLPGRVFLGKLPEWTPDVRLFTPYEYPRVNYAQCLDVRGSVAIPVFERGNCSCLGVVEVVMITQKMNYDSELNSICSALQAVNLRSSEVQCVPQIKLNVSCYQAALPEILEVLRSLCKAHNLPLAQTWIPCVQQGKRGSRHSDENYARCVSTVDSACYVNDPSLFSFHKACSEHHLLRGQGIVGRAFNINQPSFSSDVSALSKFEYPLSHHARMFNLKGAVAIRLRSTLTGSTDFVLEFFLPSYCIGTNEQKLMLESLSSTVQNVCRTLRVVTNKEIEDEASLEIRELNSLVVSHSKSLCDGGQEQNKHNFLVKSSQKHEGEGECSKGKVLLESDQKQEDLVKDDEKCSVGKTTEKRYSKNEKTVSLQILQQYFAGSLKDAAKSLGVCPTTLKRICRQYGINRWPARKIKKVNHSLKKLQVVIDSVHGADKALQLPSLYKEIANASCFEDNTQGNNIVHPVSEKDKHSFYVSSSSLSPSTRNLSPNSSRMEIASKEKDRGSAHGENSTREVPKCFSGCTSSLLHKEEKCIKVVCGSEKVRFRLKPPWRFQDLKQEIVRRCNIANNASLNLKYMDDDSEWILLTCDADLEECIHVCNAANAHRVKISASLGST
ncbi:Protein NLP1 [Ananas comosus]|uniref:Protein NLP1 n=1 Tax=Ananas comosus TaxID=4615 RepID=A0A199VG88_ANACO|nr:Protein NLP1 [Ananas comosus]